ncbi:Nucleotidyltransferase [Atractiella rhizophila]|nr:Nucleotidyltransferase [Atractiella rhizophila]
MSFEDNADYIPFEFSDDALSSASDKDANDAPPLSTTANSTRPPAAAKTKKRPRSSYLQEDSIAGLQKQRLTPWMHSLSPSPPSESSIEFLGREIEAFVCYASSLPYEQEVRRLNVAWIRKVVKNRWGRHVDIELFGSGRTGTEVPGGDIDLVLLRPNLGNKETKSTLFALSQLLQQHGICKERPIVIHKARVPIVKFETKYGGYKVDISLNQTNGVNAAKQVTQLLNLYRGGGQIIQRPRFQVSEGLEWHEVTHDGEVDLGVARCLVLLVKMFLAQRGMNEVFTGGLGSYSIICMVVSFLQLHPMIQSGQIIPARNLGILFVEFLELYGKNYNYDACGISLLGRGKYFSKMERGWWNERKSTLLSIEDPNDPSNDISSGSYNIIRVRQTFAGAYDVLCASIYQLESERAAERNPGLETLQGQMIPRGASDGASHSPSILGSIFGLSEQIIQQRNDSLELWHSGILQSMVDEDEITTSNLPQPNRPSREAWPKKDETLRKPTQLPEAEPIKSRECHQLPHHTADLTLLFVPVQTFDQTS